jgi:hypothetical protein
MAETIKDIRKDVNKLEEHVESLQRTQSQCRGKEQQKDHDVITTHTLKIENIENNNQSIKEKQNDIVEKLETVTGNLNQAMLIIKDMQTANKMKTSAKTTIITSVIAALISALLIYLCTIVLKDFKRDQSLYLQNLKQQNSSLLKELKKKQTPVFINLNDVEEIKK